MRSSPNFLVVSRSEEPPDTKFGVSRKGGFNTKSGVLPDESEYNEVNIRIKISYKTLVFAFVTFDIIRHVVDRLSELL